MINLDSYTPKTVTALKIKAVREVKFNDCKIMKISPENMDFYEITIELSPSGLDIPFHQTQFEQAKPGDYLIKYTCGALRLSPILPINAKLLETGDNIL